MPMKKCSKCGQKKLLLAFCKCCTRKDGFNHWCRLCVRKAHITRRKNPTFLEKRKRAWYRQYNITLEEYYLMRKKQKNLCALCHKRNNIPQAFAVDHDHKHHHIKFKACKKCIRGLLCDICNRIILPILERHKHLQNIFVKQYLTRRPLLLESHF